VVPKKEVRLSRLNSIFSNIQSYLFEHATGERGHNKESDHIRHHPGGNEEHTGYTHHRAVQDFIVRGFPRLELPLHFLKDLFAVTAADNNPDQEREHDQRNRIEDADRITDKFQSVYLNPCAQGKKSRNR